MNKDRTDAKYSIICLLTRYTVLSTGTFNATVLARNAIALHVGATGTGNTSAPTTVEVIFQETATTTYGEVSSPIFPLVFHLTPVLTGSTLSIINPSL